MRYSLQMEFDSLRVNLRSDECKIIEIIRLYLLPFWELTTLDEALVENWNINVFTDITHTVLDSFNGYEYMLKKEALFDDSAAFISYPNMNTYILKGLDESFLTKVSINTKTIDHYVFKGAPEDYKVYMHIIQLIKEPVLVLSKERGYVSAHCAACSYKGKGILIIGDKGKGKTTLLMHFLNNGAKYIGNDIALLKSSENGLIAYAFPHFLRLGIDTVYDNEILEKEFDKKEDSIINKKFQIRTESIERIFSISSLSHKHIDLILFPKIDSTANNCSIIPTEKGETCRRVRHSIENQDMKANWLLLKDPVSLHNTQEKNIQLILKHLNSAHEISYGNYDTNPVQFLVSNKLLEE